MAAGHEIKEPAPRSRGGPLRRFLKLIVSFDSSRSVFGRLKSALALVALLAVFAAFGYGLPLLFSRYF